VWRPGAEVYIQGVATLVDDPAEKARIWRSGALSFDPAAFFGSPDNPEFVLVRVRPERAVVLGPGGPSTWRAATGSG
jgi:general stress protein 26